MKTKHHLIYLFLPLLLVNACKVGKDYQRPATGLPARFNATAYADTSSIADISWKQFFADTTLQRLIGLGIAHNYDLQIALKNIDASAEQLKRSKLLLLPEVNLQVTGQYNRPSDNSLNGLSASGFLGSHHIEDYNANLGLSWELDIWGKIRRQKEVVLAQYLQTYEATKAVQTQVVANIAQAYYNLRMLDKQLAIARENLQLNDTTTRLTQLLKNAGEANLLAVQQAQAQQQATALLIPQLEQSIAIQENNLQVLTGQLPGEIKRIKGQPIVFAESSSPGLPAAILSRRPDVRATEMALKAANAQVGAAQGNMYPSFTISASGGVESLKSSTWFNIPASLFGIANGSLLQPLFNQRELKTRYETAKIQRDQAALSFRQSVLSAVGEVSNALVQADKLKEQRKIADNRTNTLHQAVRNAQLLFKSDMANYLEVITAQGNALQAELDLATIERQQAGANVELYRALGGGWK